MLPLLLIGILFFAAPPSYSSDFTVNQNITYRVKDNGQASAVQVIELVNNLSQVYPKIYQIDISGAKIDNIQAYDNLGNILKSVTNTDSQTHLQLSFNHPNIGRNQKNTFTLSYNVQDFATRKGNTWEIALPQYRQDTTAISLLVPLKFGRLSFSSIKPTSTDTLGPIQQFRFLLPADYPSKTLIIFGNYQLFDFTLTYYLTNQDQQLIKTEIAIPPDTSSQKITYRSISPPPSTINQDSDGNWLAQYDLAPGQQLSIIVDGQAKIIPPLSDPEPPPPPSLIQEQDFWPTGLPAIQTIAQSLKTPRQIYDYVVDRLGYNSNLIGNLKRQGALAALSSPQQSLCTEFTDLFITIARAQGIPAREIEGFAYSNNLKIKPTNPNADILHAWPQYYNTSRHVWQSIDPTWAKTSGGIDYFNDLDLNHFAFVIHGVKSNYPPPPGSFRPSPETKTVSVNFAQNEIDSPITPPRTIIQFRPFQTTSLIITNPNLVSLNQVSIDIDQLNAHSQILRIPPLGASTVKLPSINFFRSLLPINQKIAVSLRLSELSNTQTTTMLYRPHLLNLLIFVGGVIMTLILSGIILAASKTIL